MKKISIIIIIFTIGIIGIIVFVLMNFPMKQIKSLTLNNKNFKVEIVKSESDQEKGLGYRDGMDGIDGMLFSYSNSKIRSFWMRGMRFDLDFIWINKGKIVGFTENVLPVCLHGSFADK